MRSRSAQAAAALGSVSRHQDHELLAAGSHDDVVGAQLVDQQPGDAHQHLVAGVVAEAVVDRLEVIEVEHGEAAVPGAALAGQPLELAREVAAGAPG